MTRTIPALVGAVVAVLAAAHLLLPSSPVNGAISTLPLMAHSLAFPLISGTALAMLAVVMVVGAIWRSRGGRSAASLLGGAVTFAVSGALVALSATSISLPSPAASGPGDGDGRFVMVSWNALDHFDGSSARQIFGDLGADVAVLPELEARNGQGAQMSRIEAALTDGGLRAADYDIFESPPTGTHIAPLTVIVRRGFGEYTSVAEDQVTFGTVRLVPPTGSGLPEFLAMHTAPPVPRWMPAWSADLTTLSALAAENGGDAIVAGDLNATLRHGSMGRVTGHADVLLQTPVLERGTWPSSAPGVLRSSIDHILVPVKRYAVIDAHVVDIAGSDHAAVVAVLAPRA